MTNEQSIISVEGLVKKYDRFTAVNHISFEVQRGEIFGFLGPNGAGKSTTLEILETLRKKDSGTVSICGYNLDTESGEIKKVIGVQLQSSNYYPSLNLTELITLFAGLYNQQINPKEYLKLVDLEDKATARFKQLSGGQQQRFSLAITLLNQPQVIFLDEPTTGLDPQARRNLWDLILDIKGRGTTVVITTHYMDEAEILCDRVNIIDHGQIISSGTPDELIDQLVASGFERKKQVKKANLEDVFLHLTGRALRGG